MGFVRRLIIGLAAAALLSAATPYRYFLNPQQVADGIWMIEGSTDYFSKDNGGDIVNSVLIETGDGMVIFDTGPSFRYGTALRDVAKSLHPKGVAAVINSHHHPDHILGNQAFSDRPIYALAETITGTKGEGDAFSDNMYRILGDWMRGTELIPANRNLTSSNLTIGNRSFKVFALAGHTAADLALLDEHTGTLITGDLVFHNRAPATAHADLEDWRKSLDLLASTQHTAVVPGHGPFDHSGAAIAQTRNYLLWLEQTLTQAATDGLDMLEIMHQPIPKVHADLGSMPEEFHRSVVHLYPTIERQIMPRSN